MISHLPISMDGSCNGYQHLSAMGLDPIGGRATNLMGFDDPEDIYQWVSDLVCGRMQTDAAGNGSREREPARSVSAVARNLNHRAKPQVTPKSPGNYWPSWIANSQRMQR